MGTICRMGLSRRRSVAPTHRIEVVNSRASTAHRELKKIFSVLQHDHGCVASVDADHAATRMRTSSTKIHALHRSACSQPIGPHIGGQALTLKNVTAGEAHLSLDI